MKILGLLLFTLFALTMGCGSQNNAAQNNNTFSSQPSGVFTSANQLPTTDTSRYTVGCATAGQSTAKPQVDSRLQPGMVFDTAIRASTATAAYSATVESTITAVTPVTLIENMQVLAVSGVPGISPGMSTQATYILGDSGFSLTYSPSFPAPQPSDPSCTFDVNSTASNFSESLMSGQFVDASGKTFNAQQLVSHIAGGVTCNGASVGTGTIDLTEIVTNDIPSEGSATFCGGVALYVFSVAAKTDGTLLWGISAERTSSSQISRK